MRNQLKTVYSVLALVATLGLTSTVHGVPAFARQTGLDCNSCHAAPGYPTLNSFGAAFKAGGYTQANEDDLIGDGEALSLPKTLNMSVVYKVINEVALPSGGTATTALANPDEVALLIGGKAAKNIGFLIEAGGLSLDFASMKVVFAPELGPVRLGIVPWWSDLGPGYIFETLSTGAVRNIRAMEQRRLFSAVNNINYGGANETMQTGLGLYVWNPIFFVAFTPFFNTDAGTEWGVNTLGLYGRAAVTPSFAGMDLGVGFQYFGGGQDDGAGAVTSISTIAFDAQLMMNAGIPLSFFVTYANDLQNTASSLNIAAEAGIIPDVLMVDLAAAIGLAGADTRVGAGVKLHIARNVKLEVDVEYNITGSELVLVPLIFGAF